MIPNDYPTLNFDLGETADMIRDTVKAFTADKIAPRAAEIDSTNQFLSLFFNTSSLYFANPPWNGASLPACNVYN